MKTTTNLMEKFNSEAVHVAKSHIKISEKYENKEAFNVSQDIQMEKILPSELKSPVSLSKIFGVDFTLDFDTIYSKVVQKLKDPSFSNLD